MNKRNLDDVNQNEIQDKGKPNKKTKKEEKHQLLLSNVQKPQPKVLLVQICQHVLARPEDARRIKFLIELINAKKATSEQIQEYNCLDKQIKLCRHNMLYYLPPKGSFHYIFKPEEAQRLTDLYGFKSQMCMYLDFSFIDFPNIYTTMFDILGINPQNYDRKNLMWHMDMSLLNNANVKNFKKKESFDILHIMKVHLFVGKVLYGLNNKYEAIVSVPTNSS